MSQGQDLVLGNLLCCYASGFPRQTEDKHIFSSPTEDLIAPTKKYQTTGNVTGVEAVETDLGAEIKPETKKEGKGVMKSIALRLEMQFLLIFPLLINFIVLF